jgi:pyruvate/2-oxoglutarate dehydrogenase complex dihydrolipoamide acyltransferase (E2) component
MPFEFRLPSLGENVEEGDVLTLLVQEGDQIEAEQGVMEIETEKATMEVPCPHGGRVSKVHVSEGQTVKAGSLILTVEDGKADGSAIPAAKQAEPKAKEEKPAKSDNKPAAKATKAKEEPEAESVEAEQPRPKQKVQQESEPAKPAPVQTAKRSSSPQVDLPGDGRSSTAAGPAIRRLARELGVDLTHVAPSTPGGRITRDDVLAYVRNSREAAQDDDRVTPPGQQANDAWGRVRLEKMSKIRQTIATRMFESYSTIPQLTNFDDADITELEQIRQSSKRDYADRGIKLTALAFILKATAAALRRHPVVNATGDFECKQIIYKEYVHIGVAVDTPRGLVVPVMRDVDRKTIPQIAEGLAELSEKVRGGDFTPDDLRGGTFTISNLGAIGGAYSTPIINPPEVAILLPGRAEKRPVFVGDKVEGRLILPLSLTYDHRIVDGAAAARFLNEVIGFLEAPSRLLLAP